MQRVGRGKGYVVQVFSVMSPYRAVRELARWSDDKALDSLVIGALRSTAAELSEKPASRRRQVPASA